MCVWLCVCVSVCHTLECPIHADLPTNLPAMSGMCLCVVSWLSSTKSSHQHMNTTHWLLLAEGNNTSTTTAIKATTTAIKQRKRQLHAWNKTCCWWEGRATNSERELSTCAYVCVRRLTSIYYTHIHKLPYRYCQCKTAAHFCCCHCCASVCCCCWHYCWISNFTQE